MLNVTAIPWPSDLAALHGLNPSRYPFLLESAADDTALGRYDLLFAFPQDELRLHPDFSLTGQHDGTNDRFLDAFDVWWSSQSTQSRPASGLPFSGGWFIVLGYELAQEIEPSLDLRVGTDGPVAIATRVPIAIIRDRRDRRAWIVAESGFDAAVRDVTHDLEYLLKSTRPVARACLLDGEIIEDNPNEFIRAIERAQEYIVTGDIFQANLSRQWHGRLSPGVEPIEIYQRLRETNPAPFSGLAVFDDFAVISSSPERLLRVNGDIVETRPIAGTRPRNASVSDDAPMREELIGHPKERAEHIMVIDLERNDLGRICRAGSVEVDELMVVESYSHVHHIVSNVRGRLVDGATPGQTIAAMFPGGSITGCPKVRCMEIINELEDRPRGAYTGAMGYINRDGSGDLSILIRCMTTSGRDVRLATGCGIVTDSDPELELAETRAKAKGLLLALGGP